MLAVSVIASTFAAPHIVIAQDEEPQKEPIRERIPDYGNMVLLGTVPVDDKVDALAFTPDSKTLIASDKDTFRAYDVNTGKSVKNISAPKGVRSNFVLFTQDAKTMITANSDGAIRFYDWEKGEVSQTLEGHKNPMLGLVLSPSGKLLASSGMDRIVKVWDVETGKLVQEITGITYAPTVLIFSDDEKKLTTIGGFSREGAFDVNTLSKIPQAGRSEQFLWNLEDGQQEQTKVFDDFGPPYAVTPDGKTVVGMRIKRTKVSSTEFNVVSGFGRYNVMTGELGGDVLIVHFTYYSINQGLAVAPNKAVIAMYVGNGATYLWGGSTQSPMHELPTLRDANNAKVARFSPDSKLLATWKDDLKVKIFRAP